MLRLVILPMTAAPESGMLAATVQAESEFVEAKRSRAVKTSKALIWLSCLIVVLAFVAAAIGLFYQNNGSPFTFTTLRGQTVPIWGQGLYRYDSPITAVGFMAADALTLVLAIPLLIISTLLYARGSLKGGLLLGGALAYFVYNYSSVSSSAAYNNLFIVYVAIFSLSLFALVLALTSFDIAALPSRFSTGLPRRGIGIFLIVSGIILHLVWLVLSILPALFESKAPPEIGNSTTFITGVIDEGIVAPALIVAGILLLRRLPIGYFLATTMLVFTDTLGPNLVAGGIAQVSTGVMGIGPFIGGTLPFGILALISLGLTVALFRNFAKSATAQTVRAQVSPA